MKTNTLNNWLQNWIELYKRHTVKPKTYKMYCHAVSLIGKHDIGNVRLKKLTSELLQNLLGELADKKYSKSTIHKVKITLSQSILAANKCGLLSNKLAAFSKDDLILPNAPKKDIRALTISEQEKVIEAIRGDIHENAILFLLDMGLRLEELLNLKREDYVINRKVIKIRKSKTDTGIREVPLTKAAQMILWWQLQETNETPYIFTTSRGKKLSESAIRKAVLRVRKTSGVQNFNPHVCRHTFATRAIERGMNVKALSAVLGHSDVRFTMQRYVHTEDDFIRAEMDKLNS